MILLFLSVLLVMLFFYIYMRWISLKKYWADRNVPHLPPHPIVGSLNFIMSENAGTWMRAIYDRFRTPYVGIWLFHRPGLIVNSPEIARKILAADSNVFRDRFLSSGNSDPIGALNIFTLNDPTWSSIRKRLTSVFTTSKLKALQNLKAEKSRQLVQRINNDRNNGQLSNLRVMFADYTTDVIGIATFGVTSEATLTGTSAMRNITHDFMYYNLYRALGWYSIFFCPELTNIFRFTFFPRSTVAYMKKVFRQIVNDRGGYMSQRKQNDILDAIINIKVEADKEGNEITEDMLVAQAAIFLQGGFDTSAGALTFAVYELAYHPDIQERLYRELVDAGLSANGEQMDGALLAELPYLNAIIKEVLRRYPIMGWLDRIAATDYFIDDHLKITAGTPVFVNALGMHFDPELFPEPEKFNPDRFLPENESNIKPFTYMPFGEGPRQCIGIRFGNQTVRYALSTVVLNFKMVPLKDFPPPSEFKPSKKGVFLLPNDNMFVNFVPRM